MDDRALFRNWADLADAKLAELGLLMSPVGSHSGFSPQERQSIGFLTGSAIRSSGSVLILAECDRVWDAEIVSRSALEATLKFCYLLGSREALLQRNREFSEDLPDIGALADHEKAKKLLALGLATNDRLTPITEILLSDAAFERISKAYPKSERRALQSRWGVSGIVENMIRSDESLGKLAAGFLHSYAMHSHVAHADHVGIGMAVEREQRSPERRQAANRAHLGSVISAQIWFAALRTYVGYAFINLSKEPISAVMSDDNILWTSLMEAERDWYQIEYGINLDTEITV